MGKKKFTGDNPKEEKKKEKLIFLKNVNFWGNAPTFGTVFKMIAGIVLWILMIVFVPSYLYVY